MELCEYEGDLSTAKATPYLRNNRNNNSIPVVYYDNISDCAWLVRKTETLGKMIPKGGTTQTEEAGIPTTSLERP